MGWKVGMEDSDQILQEKYTTMSAFLDEEYTLIHLDPRAPGVQLPDHLMGGPTVTLKLSRLFRGSLDINEREIAADLLFDGTYFTCIVPLRALWGCTNDRGKNIIWPESTPKEVLNDILESASRIEQDGPEPAKKAAGERPKRKVSQKKGHLRRVK